MTDPTSRRRTPRHGTSRHRLARPARLAAVLALAVSAAACGSDGDSGGDTTDDSATDVSPSVDVTAASPETAPTEPVPPETVDAAPRDVSTWSFTDDRGETVTFDEQPTRVVAWQAIVPALVELGIEPVGVIAFNDLATNPAFIEAGVDVDALTAVSTSYGEVDIEALAALEPDLILTYTFGGDYLQGFTDGNTQELAGQVAPFIAMDANAPVLTGIERMDELAEVLGADLGSEQNQQAAADFDEAVASLEALAAERPGLTAAFGGPSPDGLFVAPTESYPELQFYEELGLDVFSGTQDSVVSWELVEGVDADVFLIDDRSTPEELADLSDVATWRVIPAVAAEQYSATWRFLLSYSRADYARTINRMLPTLTAADPDVV